MQRAPIDRRGRCKADRQDGSKAVEKKDPDDENKEYEDNEEYLDELKNKEYDLLFSNPPC